MRKRMACLPRSASADAVQPLMGAGFILNWWAGVETLHNLFVKEHNYLCGMLREVGSHVGHRTAYVVITLKPQITLLRTGWANPVRLPVVSQCAYQ